MDNLNSPTNQLPPNHTGPNPITPNIQGPVNSSNSPSTSRAGDQKKQLLKKLLDHILSKPASSIHETISALNDALSAYKNYAKEHDILHGGPAAPDMSGVPGMAPKPMMPPVASQATPPPMSMVPPTLPQAAPVKSPTPMPQPPMPPQGPPPSGMGGPGMIAGPNQQSDFNRPAPVNSLGIHGY